jgi:outer membrane receptor for ferric coprogen and ferric-rhodotorulic acid
MNMAIQIEEITYGAFGRCVRLSNGLVDLVVTVGAGELTVRADYAWQDKVQFNVINDFNYQGSYGTLNGRVALASPAGRWELALFGHNLTGERYAYTGGTVEAFGAAAGGAPVPTPTIAWNIPGAPRTYGIEGTYRFNPAH